MPNHASAIKRDRQSIKRRTRNRAVRSEVRSTMRNARAMALEGNAAGAKELLKSAESLLSRAAAKGLMHHRTASRKISRLASFVAKTIMAHGTKAPVAKTKSSKSKKLA